MKCTFPYIGWIVGRHDWGLWYFPKWRTTGPRINKCRTCGVFRYEEFKEDRK
jgi:hypothetical protein